MRRLRTSGLLGLAAMAVLAADGLARAQDAPISTSNGSAAPKAETAPPKPVAPPVARTTAEQIDDYLRSSPALADGETGPDDGLPLDTGVHGEVSVGVGTHGYREVYVRAETPIGTRGRLSVAVGETRGRGLVGPCGPVELDGPEVLRLDPNCVRRPRPVFPLPAQ